MLKIRQNSFLAGQLDFEMMGRQDFQKYQKGASVLRNFNILKRGGITKRQGFDRLVDLKAKKTEGGQQVAIYTDGMGQEIDEDSTIRLVPFGYKKDNGFVLMFVAGKAYAICTTKGCLYLSWEINYSGGSSQYETPVGSGGLQNEVNEFDYAQCGYRMFIAHHNHFPSVIETSESKINAAIDYAKRAAAGQLTPGEQEPDPPFTWTPINMGGISSGIPSITGAYQERIAPSADTAGGTYTEKYKVSAVFDDVETKPCTEFYNESYILPVSIGDIDGTNRTLVQKSESVTAAYRTTTYGSNGTSVTGYNSVPQVTNTSRTWSNKVKASCNGTKYHLPWVESQSIKLYITANLQKGKLPDHINVYKKAYGYYGLIGTVSLGGEAQSTVSGVSGGSNATESEVISSDRNNRAYSYETRIINDTDDAVVRKSVYHTCRIIPQGTAFIINAYGVISSASKVSLVLGAMRVGFTSFYNNTRYDLPTGASFTFQRSTATTANVEIGYSYYNNSGSLINSTLNATWNNIAQNATYTAGSFSATYTNFKNGIEAAISEWANSDAPAQQKQEFTFGNLSGYPANTDCQLNYIKITPTNGQLAIVSTNAVARSANVEFIDNNITPNASITPIETDFDLPFQGAGNHPSTVCISQQRLIWGSSDNQPETVWMSAIGDFGNYVEHEVQKDDDSIEFDMPVTRFARLNHIVEMRQLIAFNSACEWLIASTSAVKGITYETIQARPQSYSGSNARLKPLICNNSVVFSERTGQSVRRFAYSIQDDGFAGRDVSVLSSSIFENNSIVDWTYQQHPFSMIWCVLSDGSLASFTFMEEQDIMAWATHKHGGGKIKAIATSYAMSPSLDEVQDSSSSTSAYDLATHEETFALVHTDDNQLWIERMRIRSDADDSVYHSICLDSVRVLNPTNQSQPLADTRLTYIDGLTGETLTKARANTNRLLHAVYEGYRYEAKFTSVFPIIGQVVGTGQFDIKNITNLGLRLEASCGGEVESEGKAGDKEPIRYDDDKGEDKTPIIAAGNAKFFNVNAVNVKPIGVNTRDGRVTVTQNEPYPFTIISLEIDYATEREQSYNAKQV